MVKKLRKMAEKQATSSASLMDSHLAQTVRESAQQIWLAGLGAFAKAQEEGGKVFEALVKEGVSLQKKTQAAAEDRIGGVTSRMSHMAGGITDRAGQQWDKLEAIFEERVARAQEKLGVPTRRDIEALSRRIDALSAAVARLGGESEPARKAPRKRSAKPEGSDGASRPAARTARRSAASASAPAPATAPEAPAPVPKAPARRTRTSKAATASTPTA